MVYPRVATEFWYWCEASERWQECSEEDYVMKHWGKSFTKRVEPDVNSATFPLTTTEKTNERSWAI